MLDMPTSCIGSPFMTVQPALLQVKRSAMSASGYYKQSTMPAHHLPRQTGWVGECRNNDPQKDPPTACGISPPQASNLQCHDPQTSVDTRQLTCTPYRLTMRPPHGEHPSCSIQSPHTLALASPSADRAQARLVQRWLAASRYRIQRKLQEQFWTLQSRSRQSECRSLDEAKGHGSSEGQGRDAS